MAPFPEDPSVNPLEKLVFLVEHPKFMVKSPGQSMINRILRS
jgi:hypothetical protein